VNNKYNLDYYETMNIVSDFVDTIEDNLNFITKALKDQPEELEVIIQQMKEDTDTILALEDKLNMFLETKQYQEVCNQLIINTAFHIYVRDVLPECDTEFLEGYLESLSEQMVINDVTKIIDKYEA